MSEFFSERTIKKTAKAHRCFGCNQMISIGSSAQYFAMKDEGQFFDAHYHVECRTAEIALNELHDTWGDEYSPLCLIRDGDEPIDDIEWLKEAWPIVAERMRLA